MKKKLIPFSWLPKNWMLRGKDLQIAKTKYHFSGEELERKLNDIENENDIKKHRITNLDIDRKYLNITQYEYEIRLAEILNDNETDQNLAKLKIELEYQKITEREYKKKKATLLNEPWFEVTNAGLNEEDKTQGFFELDWNSVFVEDLKDHGFGIGLQTEEQIVDEWFCQVCLNISQSFIEEDDIHDIKSLRKRTQLDDGKAEYR